MTNLTSSLTIKLVDDVSKPARTVAQALEQAEKQAKAVAKSMADSGATGRFTANLSKMGLAGKDIERVARAWKDYSTSAKLAANASEWTKAQAADVRRWETQTIKALRDVEREQARFARASARAARAGVHPGTGGHGGGAWSHQGALGYTAQGAAAAVSAHSVFHWTKEGIEAGAERQHVRVGMRNAGMTAAEVKESEELSINAARGAPNMSVSEIMELHKEARSAVQHPKEALELLPMLAKASSVLKGMGADNNNIAELVKAGESLGLMNDPKRFRTYLEGQVKAMAVMGKTIDTSQAYEAAKYSKSAGANLSDRFLNTVFPSLIQEMHGSSSGDALAMLTKTIRGGLQHKHTAVERLNELGMLEDPTKIRRSKTGQIMGYKGKIVGDDVLANDPDKFAKIFDEHMEAHGIHKLEDKVKVLNETLPSTAANVIRILIQQAETLKQHAINYDNAPGLDQAAKNQLQDPIAAVGNLTKSLNDLGAAVTSPAMAGAGKTLSSIANGIRELAEAAKEHPKTAMAAGGIAAVGGAAGAGWLSYQFLNGFGMKPAANTMLRAAEIQLTAANKQAGGLPPGTPGGAPPDETKTNSPSMTSLWGRALTSLFTVGPAGYNAAAGASVSYDSKGNPILKPLHPEISRTVDEWWKTTMPTWFGGKLGGSTPRAPFTKPDDDLGLPSLDPVSGPTGRRGFAARMPPPSPFGDLSGAGDLKRKADEAKAALEGVNGMAVAPIFNGASLDEGLAKVNALASALRSLPGLASGVGAAVAGIKIPNLGAAVRGHFSDAGDPGR